MEVNETWFPHFTSEFNTISYYMSFPVYEHIHDYDVTTFL